MWFRTLFDSLKLRGSRTPARRQGPKPMHRRAAGYRPQLEALEDRSLPSTFTVLNLLDSGDGSLREAVAAANANPGADTIDFATTGAIALTSGQLDITDSLAINGPGASDLTVSGNDASQVFAITGSNTNVLIRDLSIVHGYAPTGGGISNAAVLTVSNCTLSWNASSGGGAIANWFGTLTVNNSTLSYNSATGDDSYGGAIYNYYGTLTVTNSTISNNAAVGSTHFYAPDDQDPYTYGTDAIGGGLYTDGGTVSIDHSTIADNYASGGSGDYPGTGYGGGIYNYTAGALQVYDTIIAYNSADYGYGGSDLDGYVTSLGHNLIGDSRRGIGFAASDLLDVNPLLGPLQDNGGPTQTMALLPGSPAINTGDDTGAPAYDQRGPGFLRVFGGAIDIGAFEAQSPSPPAVFISDVSLSEGNVGATAAVFTVQLSAASTDTVLVQYTTADGSATVSDNDYQMHGGTLTFAAGETSKTITVLVNGDRRAESNETFFVNLSDAANATIADGQGVGTIVDDEPRIDIDDVTRTEGHSGTTQFIFTVLLSAAYDAPVTIDFTTADGTATAGSDYQVTAGTLTIPAGQTSGSIGVLVNGDRLAEPNESFAVNLSNPVNAGIGDGQGVGTIVDDEPRISISDVTKSEGRKGKTTLFTFTITLSAAYDQAVTMSYRTVDGTATSGSGDYIAKSGTLTFAAGETTKTVTIEVKTDNKKEANETFYLDLYDLSSNSSFTKNRGLGTILNDD